MLRQPPDLIATYWTIAGDVYPMCPDELSPFPFEDRVEAAALAGYRGAGFIHQDLRATERRLGFKEMRRIMDANGMRQLELEFLAGWYAKGEVRTQSDVVRADLFRAAGELGARAIKVAPSLDALKLDNAARDMPIMVEEFSALAQQAATYGTTVALEIMPFSNIRTIPVALEIVSTDPQPAGGLYLDIWHIARGGIPFAEVARIPKRYVKAVELDDATAKVKGTLWEDTCHNRRLCGEGVLDCKAFIKAISATGYTGPFAVEIISSKFRKWPLKKQAQKSFETTFAQFK